MSKVHLRVSSLGAFQDQFTMPFAGLNLVLAKEVISLFGKSFS